MTKAEATPTRIWGRAPGDRKRSPYRLMVVDDSAVIRGLLIRSLEADPEITVVASASNGEMALAALTRFDVEIVILDIEMPVMDGLTALPRLLAAKPGVQVIIASTLTRRGADISMRALAAGAADYLTKPGAGSFGTASEFKRDLLAKVKVLGRAGRVALGLATPRRSLEPTQHEAENLPFEEPRVMPLRPLTRQAPEVLAIGSSTGGPHALFRVLGSLGGALRQPVFVTQHMPATFTSVLAEHIARASGCPAAEGTDGEAVRAGRIYVAPGDFHLTVEASNGHQVVRLSKEPAENYCRPSVDPMLRSLAAVYGPRLLCLILTGMGRDGLGGCRAVVQAGGTVIAQDEATSVVWGMPGAVARAGLCSAVLALDDIGPFIGAMGVRAATR